MKNANCDWFRILFIVCAVLLCGCGRQESVLYAASGEETARFGEDAGNADVPAVMPENESGSVPADAAADGLTEKEICVDVCGAVASPGVYMLPEGSRVFEAIELAGGFTDEAESRMINRAGLLSDGQQIIVPTKDEVTEIPFAGDAAPEKDGRIDINTADAEKLTELPGIGPSRAAAVIAYREEHGRFLEPEEIMEVSGIGQALFDSIKDRITVGKE